MKLYSTRNKNHIVDLKEATLKSLAPDGGLYMPCEISPLPKSFWEGFYDRSFQENSFLVARSLMQGFIPDIDLKEIIYSAINFKAPLVSLDKNLYSLELFHGPSLAFKDFGARFMSRLMSYFNKTSSKLTILVATSGDTGGAVAAGFYNTPNIEVIILYPSGKVSPLQEKQLTTLGKNITAIEVKGTFDHCQTLVKKAFLDQELNKSYNLASANSINIARLIPQCFYYFEAVKQLKTNKEIVVSIPSGNFGNMTAGLIAKRMGLPIHKFIAATNINDIVPSYLETGKYKPRASKATISNAMDVGNPSNFTRLLELYSSTWNIIKKDVQGFSMNDNETTLAIREAYNKYQYICDPHGAIGLASLKKLNENQIGVFLETAHPSKFLESMESILGFSLKIPNRLKVLAQQKKESILLDSEFTAFKKYLLERNR